jgi:integrase
VADVLGHSQIGLTLDTYSHLMPGVREDAAEKMDALLRG